MADFTMKVRERQLFESMRPTGPCVHVDVTVEEGFPPHVRQHIRAALQNAITDLLAYDGPGKQRSISTVTTLDPYPLSEEYGGA